MSAINNIKIIHEVSDDDPDDLVKPVTSILSNNVYKGKRCFILGGGPSFSASDFQKIKDEITIGINKALFTYPCKVNYAMDEVFYRNIVNDRTMRRNLTRFKGIAVWASKKGAAYQYAYTIQRLRKKNVLSLDLAKGLNPGNNSGWGALNLAMILGCNPIYLLGYDFKIGEKTHWHDGYEHSRKRFETLLQSYVHIFNKFAPIIKLLGFRVVNLNKESALNCFDKKDIGEIL